MGDDSMPTSDFRDIHEKLDEIRKEQREDVKDIINKLIEFKDGCDNKINNKLNVSMFKWVIGMVVTGTIIVGSVAATANLTANTAHIKIEQHLNKK